MVQLLQVLALNVRNQGARFRGGPENGGTRFQNLSKKKEFFASVLQIQLHRKLLGKKGGKWEANYVLSK